MYRFCSLVNAGLVAGALTAPVLAEPSYDFGDTGVFGSGLGWNFNQGGPNVTKTNGAFSSRFTVFESITLDRVYQRYRAIDPGTILTIGIQGNNAVNDTPSGTFIASAIDVDIPDGNQFVVTNLGSVTLTPGVYHLVTQPTAMEEGDSFSLYRSSTSSDRRVSDGRVDTLYNNLQLSGGNWAEQATDPWFYFMNGDDTATVKGPGLSIKTGTVTNASVLTGDTSVGQVFSIDEKLVPDGAFIDISEVTVKVKNVDDSAPFTISLRELDGTVIATTAAITPGSDDSIVTEAIVARLEEGVEYLLTLDTTGDGEYTFETHLRQFIGGSLAGYGAREFRSVFSDDDWASFGDMANGSQDISFELTGEVVVPEPGAGRYDIAQPGFALHSRPSPRLILVVPTTHKLGPTF